MAWVYVDDHWDEHPKLVAAYGEDPRAIALFFSSLAYCRRNNTDGLVLGPKVRGLLGWTQKSQRVLQTLVLWEPQIGGSVMIHDYGEWNRLAASKSASARNAARVRWGQK